MPSVRTPCVISVNRTGPAIQSSAPHAFPLSRKRHTRPPTFKMLHLEPTVLAPADLKNLLRRRRGFPQDLQLEKGSRLLSAVDVTVPRETNSIAEAAFRSNTRLEHVSNVYCPSTSSAPTLYVLWGLLCVKLPLESLRFIEAIVKPREQVYGTIRPYAFADCPKLVSVRLPRSASVIMCGAFLNCKSLTDVTMPRCVSVIGSRCFESCVSLTTIPIPAGTATIGKRAFRRCHGLKEITLVTGASIGPRAFEECQGLTTVTVSKAVDQIGEAAWQKCTALTCVTIASGPEWVFLGKSVFAGCRRLTKVVLPRGVKELPTSTFADCTALVDITLPSDLRTIHERCFQCCSSLRRVMLPTTVAAIRRRAFEFCVHLEEVTIPPHTAIATCAFSGCESLSKVTFSGPVSIGRYAFQDCTSLTIISIPNGSTIDDGGFARCSSLKTAILSGTTEWTPTSFPYGCTIVITSESTTDDVLRWNRRSPSPETITEEETLTEEEPLIGVMGRRSMFIDVNTEV